MDTLNFHRPAQSGTFKLEGRLVGWVSKQDEKPKRIIIATAEGERCIKLSKLLRISLGTIIQPGDWIEVCGEQKYKDKTGKLKLKAHQITLKSRVHRDKPDHVWQPPIHPPQPKASVILCQKSACRKRGSAAVHQAMMASLGDCGLQEQVVIKETGCMKQCKQGPCMVVMPDKSRYTQVHPKNVPMLVEKHFASKLKPEVSEPQLCPVRS